MFNWIKKHKKLIAFITFMIIFGIPLIILVLFKLHSNIDFFVAEWTADELLSYYGSILAFLGTVILVSLSLYQNQIIKQESDKRTALLEQRKQESNMPRFSVVPTSYNGSASNLGFNIINISENTSQKLIFYDIKILNSNKESHWEANVAYSFEFLPANETRNIKLSNPAINDGFELHTEMNYLDKHNESHTYIIKGHMYGKKLFQYLQ